jgi:hypothetical protein
MASYEIVSRVQTREVRGTKLVKVREFGVVSLPSETYFQFRRDASQPCYSSPGSCAQQFADRIEAVLADPRVTDVVYSQDTLPGGRLIDLMTTYFASPDGAVEGSVEQRLAEFGPNRTLALVAAELGEGSSQLAGGGGGGGPLKPQ